MDQSPEPSSCPFCKVVAGTAPARIVYRDDSVTAFHDIHPIATIHILVVPNRHIASLNDLGPGEEPLIGHMVMVAKQIASKEGIADRGYRLIMNTGADSGQSVFHLHLHLIGGKLARFHLG
jgi:histidine triad (HIT) family protein